MHEKIRVPLPHGDSPQTPIVNSKCIYFRTKSTNFLWLHYINAFTLPKIKSSLSCWKKSAEHQTVCLYLKNKI